MKSGFGKVSRRQIRRALGPQATDALLDVQTQAIEIERFLLLSHSLWRRVWWFVTGKF